MLWSRLVELDERLLPSLPEQPVPPPPPELPPVGTERLPQWPTLELVPGGVLDDSSEDVDDCWWLIPFRRWCCSRRLPGVLGGPPPPLLPPGIPLESWCRSPGWCRVAIARRNIRSPGKHTGTQELASPVRLTTHTNRDKQKC